jgi:hypothetical protein
MKHVGGSCWSVLMVHDSSSLVGLEDRHENFRKDRLFPGRYSIRMRYPLYGNVPYIVLLEQVLNEVERHEYILGSGGIAPRILNLGTRCRWLVSFMPQLPHLQGKCPRYALDRRLGGLQSRSVRGDREQNPNRPGRSLAAELSRL